MCTVIYYKAAQDKPPPAGADEDVHTNVCYSMDLETIYVTPGTALEGVTYIHSHIWTGNIEISC